MRSVKPEELDALIAGNVRAQRGRLKLRQEDLADDMGVDRKLIVRIEAGQRRITISDALALCAALHLDLRQLLAGVEPEALETFGLDRRA